MTTIKLRRDTAANWTSNNPVLAAGEPGVESDTTKIKYGDGTTAWNSLGYVTGGATTLDELSDVVITAAASGEVLYHNGTNWVDTPLSTLLASPGAIGATTAAAGTFTSLSSTGLSVQGGSLLTKINCNLGGLFLGYDTAGVSQPRITLPASGTGALDTINIGAINPGTGTFTTLTAATTTLDDIRETVFSLGTTSGTIAPNAANGSIQTITLNGNLTINAFTSPVSGQTITLIITTGGTGRTLTSSMLFAGASKTLSTTSTVDILTMSYIGTTYYASLVKGYA